MIDQFRTMLPGGVRTALKQSPIGSLYTSRPVQRLRAKTITSQQATIPTEVGTITLDVSPYSGLLAHNEYPGYEPGLVERLAEIIDGSTTLYDVGAGYGFNCNVALAAGALPANIHLFEASAFRFPFLVANTPECPTIETFVSDFDSEECSTIDSYVRENAHPDVITMDIEGAEPAALRGMTTLLEEADVEVLIEMHPHKMPDQGGPEIFETLRSLDYQLDARDHRDPESSWQDLGPSSSNVPEPEGHETYLLRAVPKSQ